MSCIQEISECQKFCEVKVGIKNFRVSSLPAKNYQLFTYKIFVIWLICENILSVNISRTILCVHTEAFAQLYIFIYWKGYLVLVGFPQEVVPTTSDYLWCLVSSCLFWWLSLHLKGCYITNECQTIKTWQNETCQWVHWKLAY